MHRRTIPLALAFAALTGTASFGQWKEASEAVHTFTGEAAGDQFGYEAANAGDADGDGIDDVVIGAPFNTAGGAYAGRAYVYSGKTGEELFVLTGRAGELLGWSVAGAGDVDGDGRADSVVGAPETQKGPGRVYVFSGRDGSVLFELEGENKLDKFGDEVEAAGDWNRDGHADIVVGASAYDADAKDSGRVYVFSGKDGSTLFVLDGEGVGHRFGSSVAGYADASTQLLVVGAPKAGAKGKGRVFVYRGPEAEPFFQIDADDTATELGSHFVSIIGDVDGDAVPDIYASDWKNAAKGTYTGRAYVHSGADGRRVRTFTGSMPGEGFGIGNARAGDCDGDGSSDLILGAWINGEAAPKGGKAYLVSGTDGSILSTWTGSLAGDTFGFDATGLGDVNGDGRMDFLISSAWSSASGKQSGRVYVVSGKIECSVSKPDAKPDESRPTWKKTKTDKKSGLEASLRSARLKLRERDHAGAEEILRKLSQTNPDNGHVWFYLGYALHMQKKFAEAIKANQRAVEFPVVRVNAMYNTGCSYALMDKPDLAFQWLRRARSAGFRDFALLRKDSDLESLRDDPRFAGLLPTAKPPEESPWIERRAVAIHTFTGESAGDQFGWVATDVGDANRDGIHDILVGAPFHRDDGTATGCAYLYSGRTGRLLHRWVGGPQEQLGFSVSTAGDFDGDGRADALIGAPTPGFGAGKAYVFSGKTGELLHVFFGESHGDRFGDSVASLGDLNGDGMSDVVVAAPQHDGNGRDAGRVYVFSAAEGKRIATLNGERAGDAFGSALAGEGGDDPILAVGAQNAGDGKKGRVYIFKGRIPERAFVLAPDDSAVNYGRYFLSVCGDIDGDGTPDLYSSDWEDGASGRASGRVYLHSGADGKRLRTLSGAASEGFGIGNARAGDVDGDGHADLIVGAWLNGEGAPRAGKAYLISGKTAEVLRTWTGAIPGDAFGFDSTGVGDVDGDGAADFVITSAYNGEAGDKSGRVYVLSGALFQQPTDR